MTAFDPFAPLNCSRGAPLGRASSEPSAYDGKSRLHVRAQGGDKFYDRGGAYWGMSSDGPVWAVYTSDGAFCRYVRAWSRDRALQHVESAYLSSIAIEV
jgi:hypothetical protein